VFNALCQHFLKSSSLRPRARALSFSLENCQKARALEPRAPDSIHHSPVQSLGIKSWTGNLTSQFGITPRDERISRRWKDLEKTCGLSLSLSLSKTGPRRRGQRTNLRSKCGLSLSLSKTGQGRGQGTNLRSKCGLSLSLSKTGPRRGPDRNQEWGIQARPPRWSKKEPAPGPGPGATRTPSGRPGTRGIHARPTRWSKKAAGTHL
jgi:hypothetical protein